jgi:hypothetical protein
MAANHRECRHFAECRKTWGRDSGGWLGRQDSNLGMAESKSDAGGETVVTDGHLLLTDRTPVRVVDR